MYTVLSYGMMATDRVRMEAYERVIAKLVRPDSVVLDLGAGTGVLSLLAARAGARRVIAIEPNPCIQLLPALAKENGFRQIEIHQRKTSEVTLDEPADIVLSDLRGSFPLHEEHVAILVDARRRLLAPNGILVPQQDRLFAAGFESEKTWHELARGWSPFQRHGWKAEAVQRSVTNSVHSDKQTPLSSSDLLTEGAEWGRIVYGEDPGESVSGSLDLRAVRSGTLHGFTCWFRATVAEGIEYTNAPGATMVYGRMILPLETPVDVRAGDAIAVTIRVSIRGDRWAWDSAVGERRFRQSTFLGAPSALEDIMKLASGYKPRLAASGERLFRILRKLDGTMTVEELAASEGVDVEEVRSVIQAHGR